MKFGDMTPTPVSLPTGIVLNYVRSGTGPSLIMIHGGMGDWTSWNPQWDAFTEHYDCIAYSRRYSHPNPNELNTRDHSALVDAADLEDLMDALGIEQAILVGSSYGGFTALAMAVRSPDRVTAIVAVEAPMMRYAFKTDEGAEIARTFLAAADDPARAAFENGDDEMGVRILTGGIVGKDPSEIPAAVLARRMRNVRAARSLSLSDDEFPMLAEDALSGLEMPVFLISGGDTAPVHTAIFNEVVRTMPQAKAMIVAGSGHSVSQQQSEVFNTEVLQFLSEALTGEQAAQ